MGTKLKLSDTSDILCKLDNVLGYNIMFFNGFLKKNRADNIMF